MPLFDTYVAVDWSAAKSRGRGAGSIWIAVLGRDRPLSVENPPTRAAATERVREILVGRAAAGDRILDGFDFAYGFPRGFRRRGSRRGTKHRGGGGGVYCRSSSSTQTTTRTTSRCRGDAERATRGRRLLGSGDSRVPPTKTRSPPLP